MKEVVGQLLVVAQFTIAAVLLWGTNWAAFSWGAVFFFTASLLLAIWSFTAMRPGSFNIRPTLKQGAELICSGPYRYIRNPMYVSVLLACAGLLTINCSWLRGGLFLLLFSVLFGKICLEEQHLRQCFPHYKNYYSCTGRMLPKWRGPRP